MQRKQPLLIPLDRKRSTSLQNQLSDGLRDRIRSGVLRPGDGLPSSRDLAAELGVSRNTVIAAYDRLLGEGYLDSEQRTGVFVSSSLTGKLERESSDFAEAIVVPRPISKQLGAYSGPRAFRPSQPDVSLFPVDQWNRVRRRAMRKAGLGLLQYQTKFALGAYSLRKALADYLHASRGVRCDWSQIAITTGSQQALYLLSQLLLKARDTVYIEDPGYIGAQAAFRHAGAKLRPIAIDERGLIPPPSFGNAKLIYATPSRQFPTGASLPVARRMSLLQTASASKAYVIEDDYDSEFRYASPPLPSLHSLDRTGRVIYLGSMSKVLFPSLRIGYLVLPPELIDPFESLRILVEDHGPLIDQATLAEFIESGAFYSHIRRCRKAYQNKLEVFLEAAAKHHLPLRFPAIEGGMNVAGYLSDGTTNCLKWSQRFEQAGLDLPPLSRYSLKRTGEGFLFGFTAFDRKTIQSGLATLALCLQRE